MEASIVADAAAAAASASTSEYHLHETISCFCTHPETEEAFRRSGCSTLTDFLDFLASFSDTLGVAICLTGNVAAAHELAASRFKVGKYFYFCAERVRSLEEQKEAGSFLCFLRALTTSCKDLFLENVNFESEDELSTLCQGLASPELCRVEMLYMSRIKVLTSSNSVSDASPLRDAVPQMTELLLHNSSCLQAFIRKRGATYNIPWLYEYGHPQGTSPSFHELRVYCDIYAKGEENRRPLYISLFTGLANNTSSLQELSLKPWSFYAFEVDHALSLSEMLVRNVSLTSLTLEDFHMPGKVVHVLFTSLEKNINLKHLSLKECDGEDWPSITWVLDSIRINGTIMQLDLQGTPLDCQSNKAAIEIQLAHNRANVEYLEVLQSEGSHAITQPVQPTSVRFFLCGSPYSGKTTLSRSLAKYWTKPTHHFSLRSLVSHANIGPSCPARTQGIEVTNLEKDGVKFSFWDLAGQKEYYSFHDYMLPSFANEATPTVFLFVWNPVEVDEETGKELKDYEKHLKTKSVTSFSKDFKYWLMFIASKTLKSQKFRPKLFVAITRADKTKQTGFTKNWVVDILKKFQKDFNDYLDLDVDGVFEIDARHPYAVRQVALYVLDAANNLLKSVPLVYRACDEARRLLNKIVHIKPLMAKDEFFRLCHRWLGISSVEVQEAIAHTLNNSGDLIYFKSSSLVVVDVKWFGHHIMGRLLHSSMTSQKLHHENGVWPLQCLKELLDEEAEVNSACGKMRNLIRVAFMERKSKSKDMQQKLITKEEDLATMLIELGLACLLQDGEPGIFIPASLRTDKQHRSQIEPRDYLMGDRQGRKTYMGRRLRCKDAMCTFFAPGFFPALQVKFRGTYSEHGSEPVRLVGDVIAFAREGVEVFMEFCHPEGEGQFIDILVQSHLDPDRTIQWIHEKVLKNVEEVRAGSRGLQGVELAHEVVCPACVENLDCLEERKTQAVSLEELRASLKSNLEQKGSLAKLADCLNNAFHTWQTVRKYGSTRVIDLLSSEETGRIVESFRRKVVTELNDALGIDIESEVCNVEEPESSVFSSTPLIRDPQLERVFNEVREGRKDSRKIHKDIQELRKDVQKMVASLDIIHNAALPKLQQRVQELLKFSKEGEAGRLPRFFVVTEGEGTLRKIVATVVPGLKNVRLQLLCEHGPHLLGDQHGLAFKTLENGFLKRGLPYIITVLKVIRVAARVGAHVLVGLGDVVPDLTRGLALMVDTPKGLPAYTEPNAPLKSSASRTNFQEGQQWLRDILTNHECIQKKQIHDMFGLTCVIYPDSRMGWLCDEHRSEGQHWCW